MTYPSGRSRALPFCAGCSNASLKDAIEFSEQYRLATIDRDDLILRDEPTLKLAHRLVGDMHRILGRSLKPPTSERRRV